MFFCVIPELNSQSICLGPWYLEVICSMRSEYRQGLSCYFLLLCRVLQEIMSLEMNYQESSNMYKLKLQLLYMKGTLIFTGNKITESQQLMELTNA